MLFPGGVCGLASAGCLAAGADFSLLFLNLLTEFLEVGKKQPALDVLYDVIKSKKHRTWQKIHEPIMLKYLELCVDLRKSHLAKEGLYQYKNICQQVKGGAWSAGRNAILGLQVGHWALHWADSSCSPALG